MKRYMAILLILAFMLTLTPVVSAADELPNLTFASISIETEGAVTRNLALRNMYDSTVSLTWFSNNTDVITHNGDVIRPLPGEGDATVTLTATASNGATKEFTITVLEFTDASEVLKNAASDLAFSSISSESVNSVTQNLTLPANWKYGTYISWSSNNENIIRVEGLHGVVRRPTYGEGHAAVALTAYIGYENLSVSKTFVVKVLEESIGREPSSAMAAVCEEFDREFLSRQNILGIRNDLILPVSSNEKITISYLSQTPDVVSNDGKVFRSQEKDRIAEFVVNFRWGYEQRSLSYTMVVKAINSDEIATKISEDLAWVVSQLEGNYNLSGLNENLILPSNGPNGTQFTYSSSDTLAIGNNGTIYPSDTYKSANLTITGTLVELTDSSMLSVTVLPAGSYDIGGSEGGAGGDIGGSEIGKEDFGDVKVELDPVDVLVKDDFELPTDSKLFSDLPNGHWAYKAIKELKDRNIVSGDTAGTFRPDARLTREELVKMTVLAANVPSSDEKANFTDVPADHWSYSYVSTGFYHGIIKGRDDGSFGLGDYVTRQDAAVIIYNSLMKLGFTFDAKSTQFADFNNVADYAQNAVASLCGMGLINGKGNNMYMPLDCLTRAEAATLIWRMLAALK